MPCLISGECEVGCWRNGTGENRAELAAFPAVGDGMRRLMLPTRDRFAHARSVQLAARPLT